MNAIKKKTVNRLVTLWAALAFGAVGATASASAAEVQLSIVTSDAIQGQAKISAVTDDQDAIEQFAYLTTTGVTQDIKISELMEGVVLVRVQGQDVVQLNATTSAE